MTQELFHATKRVWARQGFSALQPGARGAAHGEAEHVVEGRGRGIAQAYWQLFPIRLITTSFATLEQGIAADSDGQIRLKEISLQRDDEFGRLPRHSIRSCVSSAALFSRYRV